MNLRTRTVEKAIKDRTGDVVKLVAARGYFYFEAEHLSGCYSTSVMVNNLNQLTLDQWVWEYEEIKRK